MVRRLISIGIDPGSSNGAIGVIDSDLRILELTYAPYYTVQSKTKQNKKRLNKETKMYEKNFRTFKWSDFKLVGDILRPFVDKNTDIIYTIEKVAARKGEGEHSAFIFGDSLGIFRGQYSLLNPIKYYEPTSSVWKDELGVTSDKSTSVNLAKKLFEDYLKNLKIKDSDNDLHEALLLAFYGLKNYVEKLEIED